MRRPRIIVVLALCSLFFASLSSAQQTSTLAATTTASVPNLIRYSGTLKDAQGATLASTTPVGVTFAIYNQEAGGAAVWQETQNVTPEATGQYSVLLGSTTAAGLPDDLFSQQERRWLGVQVQGQEEQARVLLVSVPYAFKAHEADTLGGLPPSAFVKVPSADEVSGITANPLIPSGIASAGPPATSASVPVVAGSPCPSTALNPAVAVLPIFTTLGTSDLLCDSVISQSGLTSAANVGIANNTPKTTLDVGGPVNTSQYYQIGLNTVLRLGNTSIYVGQGAGPTTLTQPDETFVGFNAGNASNGTGNFANTYIGFLSGAINTTGHQNTYVGSWSGHLSTTGYQNTLIGDTAGGGNPGNRNVMLGFEVGINDVGGNDNINIWNPGANESNTIRIGFPYSTTNCFGLYTPPCGQENTYIAGIYNVPLSPGYQQVIIDSTGHLGSTTSTAGGVSGMCGAPGSFLLTKWLTSTSVQCTNITEVPGTFNVGINGVPNAAAQLDVVGGLGNINTTDTPTSYMIAYHPVLNINPFGNRNLFVGVFTGGGGNDNTFVGTNTGEVNNGGFQNTFVGSAAGQVNTTGYDNTAMGWEAGMALNEGNGNTFLGAAAGEANTADLNTFIGEFAGIDNVTGYANTFVGEFAGFNNIGGFRNTCLGGGACYGPESGNNNIDVGYSAGTLAAGTGNIDIGSQGLATDTLTIRIGDVNGFLSHQTATYIAGIYNSAGTPTPPFQAVCVDPNGTTFGTTPGTNCVVSSLRFKDQIADMGDSSSKLFQLRPVTFFYKPQYDDGAHTLQYGLIAEEVAKVYPEMAVYDKDGQPYTVKYQLLAPMLLNELQKQHAVVSAQQDVIQTQQEQIHDLQQRLSRIESLIASK